jgi:hypothetical protein
MGQVESLGEVDERWWLGHEAAALQQAEVHGREGRIQARAGSSRPRRPRMRRAFTNEVIDTASPLGQGLGHMTTTRAAPPSFGYLPTFDAPVDPEPLARLGARRGAWLRRRTDP